MVNFVDEYPRQLDERGRIILPAKVRENMSETVYVTRSMSDKCIQLYTQEEWDKISEKINQLPTAEMLRLLYVCFSVRLLQPL